MLSAAVFVGLLSLVSGMNIPAHLATNDTMAMEVMREIMQKCGGPPAKCECTLEEEPLAFPPPSQQRVMQCLPYLCHCPDGTQVPVPHQGAIIRRLSAHVVKSMDKTDICDLEKDVIPHRMRLMMLFFGRWVMGDGVEKTKTVSKICNGREPKSCTCSMNRNMTLTFPIPNPVNAMLCMPNVCTCDDGQEVNADFMGKLAMKLLDKFRTLCSGEMPEMCACRHEQEFADDASEDPAQNLDFCAKQPEIKIARRTINPPFDTFDKLRSCHPKQCRCSSGEIIKLPCRIAAMRAARIVKRVMDMINRDMLVMCGGEAPESCACTSDQGGVLAPADFTNFLKTSQCKPKTCTCKNGKAKDLPLRMANMKRVVRALINMTGKRNKRQMIQFTYHQMKKQQQEKENTKSARASASDGGLQKESVFSILPQVSSQLNKLEALKNNPDPEVFKAATNEIRETILRNIMKSVCDGQVPKVLTCTDGNTMDQSNFSIQRYMACRPVMAACPDGTNVPLPGAQRRHS